MQKSSDEFKGVALAVSGVLILSPDTLLIRLVELDPWSIFAWRGVFQALGTIGLLLLFFRGKTWMRCRAVGMTGLAVGFVMSLGSLFFITSISLTSVANTLIIVSTSPLLAAAIAFIFLKERVPLRTVFAIGVTILGVAIMVWEDWGAGAFMGDLAAFGTALAVGVQVTLVRRRREINMVPSLIFTGLFAAIIGFSFASPVLPSGERLIYLLLMGFIVAPVAWSLTSLAPRYIPGPEVRLIFLIEVVLGPLWVWLALGEEPPKATLLGGTLVLLTLAFHAYLSLKAQNSKTSELLVRE